MRWKITRKDIKKGIKNAFWDLFHFFAFVGLFLSVLCFWWYTAILCFVSVVIIIVCGPDRTPIWPKKNANKSPDSLADDPDKKNYAYLKPVFISMAILFSCVALYEMLSHEASAHIFQDNWPNGNIRIRGMVTGPPIMRNGPWEEFYESGKIKERGNCKDDVPDGKWVSYYENGKIKSAGNYRMGEESGTWLYYDEDGNFSAKINWK